MEAHVQLGFKKIPKKLAELLGISHDRYIDREFYSIYYLAQDRFQKVLDGEIVKQICRKFRIGV